MSTWESEMTKEEWQNLEYGSPAHSSVKPPKAIDLRYLACNLLHDDYGINTYSWELLEEGLLTQGITDVANCVKVADGRWYITEEDFAWLMVP